MIKIATIEDEENIRQEIVRYIKKGIGSIEGVEVDVYESAERYLLVGGRYDLVISDIELPGISGLELGKRIKELYHRSISVYFEKGYRRETFTID